MQSEPKSISRRTLLGTGAMLGLAAAGLRPAWAADEAPSRDVAGRHAR